MKTIKFSEDYEKLPLNWQGTQATLIAVRPEKVSVIKNRYTAFWKKDTKFRGKDGYYNLDFEDGLILVFLHHNTGQLFGTIRPNYPIPQKVDYYNDSIGETFQLAKAEAP